MSRHKSATDLQVSPAVRALNPSVFMSPNPLANCMEECDGGKKPLPQKKRLRQSTKPVMNKLETRFYEQLLQDCMESGGQTIHCQAIRLELARGIWYKPDFFIPEAKEFYEVKGPRSFRGGFENLKVAARIHKWAKFYLVWEDNQTGRWEKQEILP